MGQNRPTSPLHPAPAPALDPEPLQRENLAAQGRRKVARGHWDPTCWSRGTCGVGSAGSPQGLCPPTSETQGWPRAHIPLRGRSLCSIPISEPRSPTADYAEPDVVQVSPSSQLGSSTFKPPPDEGYTLPLVVSHYDVPGKHHEYAEPLPPEPEYATPFGEPEHAGARWNPSDTAGLPAAPSRAGSPGSPPARYVSPPLQLPGVSAAPRAERTAGPHRDGPHSQQLGDCPFSHVYHEAW